MLDEHRPLLGKVAGVVKKINASLADGPDVGRRGDERPVRPGVERLGMGRAARNVDRVQPDAGVDTARVRRSDRRRPPAGFELGADVHQPDVLGLAVGNDRTPAAGERVEVQMAVTVEQHAYATPPTWRNPSGSSGVKNDAIAISQIASV